MLCPAVPPSKPLVRVPTSVTTGKPAVLTCHDTEGSPPSKYRWYKGSTLLPLDPSKVAAFKNLTYTLNTDNGNLVSYNLLHCTIFTVTVVVLMGFKIKNIPCPSLQEFAPTKKIDSGQYYCEAFNGAGPPQRSQPMQMDIRKYSSLSCQKQALA